MRRHRKHDPDFKREAVRLVIEDGMGIREAERSPGMTYGVLKGWVQKRREHRDAAFVGGHAAQFRAAQAGLRIAPELQDECCAPTAFPKVDTGPMGLEHRAADFKAEACAARSTAGGEERREDLVAVGLGNASSIVCDSKAD